MKIVLVTGGRKYGEHKVVHGALDRENPDVVIHGGATGADALAQEWTRMRNRAVLRMPAQWESYGDQAGPKRNGIMCDFATMFQKNGHEVVVLAFPGGAGTKNCIRWAYLHGLKIKEES